MAAPLTATREDYIRAIYKVAEESDTPVRIGDVAERLGLAKSTVSERVKELISIKLVRPDAQSARYQLTKKGVQAAQELTYKHRIIETFLYTILQLPEDQVHAEAHELEHACSDLVIQQMAVTMNHPSEDPHGQPIVVPKRYL